MKKKSRAGKTFIIIFSVLCFIAGAMCGFAGIISDVAIMFVMSLPFLPMFLLVAFLSYAGLDIVAVIVLTAFGLLALIYPIVKMAKRKKFLARFFLWLLLGIAAAITTVCIGSDAIFLISSVTFYCLLLLCILIECNEALKSYDDKSFKFMIILMYLMLVSGVFGCFFEGSNNIFIGLHISIGNAIFEALKFSLDVCSTVLIIVILFLGLDVVRILKNNMYDGSTIVLLNSITRLCKASIAFSLVSAIITNLSILIFAYAGGSLNYEFSFPLLPLLIVCLMVMLIGMMKRFIAEHEENKLTI